MTYVEHGNTAVTINTSKEIYLLPEKIPIAPSEILDEYNEVYRIVIGIASPTVEMLEFYQPLFLQLDKLIENEDGWIDSIELVCNNEVLHMRTAKVSRETTIVGVFYEIECSLNAVQYQLKIKKELFNASSGIKVRRKRDHTTKITP